MNVHARFALVVVVLGAIAIGAAKYFWPMWQERMQRDTSDAKDTKGRIVIGVDNWIGYFPLCSGEMKKRMRAAGYVVVCEDDKADYALRMQKLREDKLQFAVATVDAYLLNGAPKGFPGTIVAVIDESKGGDAIVAWKDKIANLDALKKMQGVKVAFTPNSPSEHLLRTMAVHFDVPALRGKGAWRVEADGSSEALKKLLARQVDVAAVWEPDVTRALANNSIVKLLGTEDTRRLIVDILLVGRSYSTQHPEAVNALLTTYFQVAKDYRENPQRLEKEVAAETKLPAERVKRHRCARRYDPVDCAHARGRGRVQGASAARPGPVPHHQPPVHLQALRRRGDRRRHDARGPDFAGAQVRCAYGHRMAGAEGGRHAEGAAGQLPERDG